MKRRYSLPFKTIIGPEVVLGRWHYRDPAGEWVHAGGGVAGWDYAFPLELRRDVEIESPGARRVCGVEPDTPMELVITGRSTAARFRRVLHREEVPLHRWTASIAFGVPSCEIAESLELDTEITLKGPRDSATQFVARYAGSRLFTESVAIEIEGTRSRMPLESVSFGQHLPWLNASRAPWYVECGPGDLHAPVMRDLRVYLNSDGPAFADLSGKANSTVLALLKAAIASQLLMGALEDEEFRGGSTDYEEGSLGEAAVRILKLCFRGMKPADVLELVKSDPSHFDAMLASHYEAV